MWFCLLMSTESSSTTDREFGTLIGEYAVCFVDEILLEELFTWFDEKFSASMLHLCSSVTASRGQ